MSFSNLIYRFLRLGPIALAAVAVAILVGAYFLQVELDKGVDERAIALEAGPPATVNIANFDREHNMSAVREVAIQAQPVLDVAYRFTIEQRGADDHVFMVPLVAANAVLETKIVGIAYFPSNEDFDNITPELLTEGISGFGNVGAIITYNGELSSMGKWRDLTEEAFVEQGLTMPRTPVVVWPYMQGREVALAAPKPGDLTAFGLLSKIAGAIGLLALAKLAFRKRSTTTPDLATSHSVASMAAAEPLTVAPVQAQPSTMPLWKQRAGYVDEDLPKADNTYDYEPATYEPAPSLMAEAAQPSFLNRLETEPQRSGFGIRKILICVVGGLFALGLFSTLRGLTGDAVTVPLVSVAVPEEPSLEVQVITEPNASAPLETPSPIVSTADTTSLVDDWLVTAGEWATKASDWIQVTIGKASEGDTTAIVYIFLAALAGLFIAITLKWFFDKLGKLRGLTNDISDDFNLG